MKKRFKRGWRRIEIVAALAVMGLLALLVYHENTGSLTDKISLVATIALGLVILLESLLWIICGFMKDDTA